MTAEFFVGYLVDYPGHPAGPAVALVAGASLTVCLVGHLAAAPAPPPAGPPGGFRGDDGAPAGAGGEGPDWKWWLKLAAAAVAAAVVVAAGVYYLGGGGTGGTPPPSPPTPPPSPPTPPAAADGIEKVNAFIDRLEEFLQRTTPAGGVKVKPRPPAGPVTFGWVDNVVVPDPVKVAGVTALARALLDGDTLTGPATPVDTLTAAATPVDTLTAAATPVSTDSDDYPTVPTEVVDLVGMVRDLGPPPPGEDPGAWAAEIIEMARRMGVTAFDPILRTPRSPFWYTAVVETANRYGRFTPGDGWSALVDHRWEYLDSWRRRRFDAGEVDDVPLRMVTSGTYRHLINVGLSQRGATTFEAFSPIEDFTLRLARGEPAAAAEAAARKAFYTTLDRTIHDKAAHLALKANPALAHPVRVTKRR